MLFRSLELLHEVVPMATVFAALINPTGSNADAFIKNAQAGAGALGLRLEAVHASTDGDLDSVFETLVRLQAGGLVIAPDQFLYARSGQIAARAVRHALPTIFQYRESAMAGGLMSYGDNRFASFRQAGIYVGRILKGEKPGDLPVLQPTKFELVLNLNTAQSLGLTIPPKIMAVADEVIE